MKTILLVLTIAGLSGCANDGTMRAEARVPLGENARYGTAIIGLGYIPPERAAEIISPTLRDK